MTKTENSILKILTKLADVVESLSKEVDDDDDYVTVGDGGDPWSVRELREMIEALEIDLKS